MKTLGEELPNEIDRVVGLIVIYASLPKGAGILAIEMMRAELRIALKAMAEGDVIAMLKAYHALKAWEE